MTPNDVAVGTTRNRKLTQWSVVDLVRVPAELPPGDYVLSFRMDCEQTPQIWSYCSDVRISALNQNLKLEIGKLRAKG